MKKITPVRTSAFTLIMLLALVISGMVMLRQCSVESPFTRTAVKASSGDTIDIAIEYSPMSMYRQNDTLGGFTYDMLRQIKADSIIIKFHPVASASAAIDGLRKGIYDVVAADLPIISLSDTSLIHSEPVYLDRQILVQLRDSVTGKVKINSSLDLGGKTVTVTADSPMMQRLHNLAEEIGDSIIVAQDDTHGPEQLFIMVATGVIDYTVINERIARLMAKDYPDVDISTKVSFTQFQSWILRSDSRRLLERLDSAIIRYKQTDSYQDLLRRYETN